MKAAIGLGNIGNQYSKTKHNFGFWIIDAIIKKSSLKMKEGRGHYFLSKENNTIYAKPTTYMNNSGIAVMELCNYFNVPVDSVLIIHDDIDLPLGIIKYKKSGGSGGHKGIESIIYQLKTDNFNRLRIGIATEDQLKPSEKYVLKPFSKNKKEKINKIIERSCNSIEFFIKNDIDKTMNEFNKRIMLNE